MCSRPEDYKIRLQAIDTQQSILLQAPAGSGKTELLSQRILALLTVVQNPEEILAVTFTNKAANEMHARVFEKLQLSAEITNDNALKPHQKLSFNLAKKVLENSQKHDWDLLNNPNRLQIKTIDAFNLSLVRRMPMLSKTGALETLETEPDLLYANAVAETLRMLESDNHYSDAIETILLHLENDVLGLSKLLVEMLKKRDQWLRLNIGMVADNELLVLKKALSLAWSDLTNGLIFEIEQQLKPYFEIFEKYARYSLDNLGEVCPKNSYNTDIESKLIWLKLFKNLVFTQSGSLRKSATKTQGFPIDNAEQKTVKAEFLEFLSEIKPHEKLLSSLSQIPPNPNFNQQQWKILQALFKVLQLCVANLQLEFSQKAKVDFIEINIRAIQSLGDLDFASDLALYLDNQINHILVDEFQDTNHSQFILLERMMSGWDNLSHQTFFAVGDPMQSIYRFREANVGLFLKVKQQNKIGNVPLNFLELVVNFRSEAGIVNWVNQTFERVFPKISDSLAGAVSYNFSQSQQKTTNESDGKVTFFGFIKDDLSSEIDSIVNTIETELNNNPTQSIGVLVRAKKDILPITLILKQRKIAFRAIELDKLNTLPIVADLRYLIDAFCYLKSSGSWLSVLRAPWCGLSLADCQHLVDIDKNASIWQLLNRSDEWHNISSSGKLRLTNIYHIFKRAFDLRTQFPLENIIRKLANALGLEFLIQRQYEKIACDLLFKALKTHASSGTIDLDLLDDAISKLYAPSLDADIKLECMTIHKSKGLEFDTVVLPKLNYRTKTNDRAIMHWAETVDGLLIAPIKATTQKSDEMYQYLSDLAKLKAIEEQKRVFYVACTRAIKNLYLFATIKQSLKIRKANKNSVLDFLLNADECLIDSFVEDELMVENKSDNRTTKIYRFSDEFLNNNQKNYPITVAMSSEKLDLIPDENNAKIIGTVFHLCCEYIAKVGVDNIELSIVFDFVDKKLKQYSVADIDFVQNKIKQLLNNMLGDKTGRWLLDASHEESHQEWQISKKVNNKLMNFVIDRCFVDEGILWIVDYKTSSPNDNESVNDFSIRMVNLYVKQLLNYQDLLTPISDYPIKLALYCPSVSLLIDL